jgi:hypothetical protein
MPILPLKGSSPLKRILKELKKLPKSNPKKKYVVWRPKNLEIIDFNENRKNN